jgi:hypothetical protein
VSKNAEQAIADARKAAKADGWPGHPGPKEPAGYKTPKPIK